MLGGPQGPRLTEENLEEKVPLGVTVYMWVEGCEREDSVILTLNLHPAVTPYPPAALLCSACSSVVTRLTAILRLSLRYPSLHL